MARKKSIFSDFIATMDGQVLVGTAGNDTMTSGYNNTSLSGGDGADTITTRLRAQSDKEALLVFQYGDAGQDTLTSVVTGPAYYAGVVQEGGAGADIITSSVGLGGDTFPLEFPNDYVEAYALGGGGDDVIRMDGSVWGGQVFLEAYGGIGNDDITLDGYAYYGWASLYAEGGAGDDRIVAHTSGYWRSATHVELYGGDGKDTLIASMSDLNQGTALLYGGDGDDILSSESMFLKAELHGGEGNDSLRGGDGETTMYGGGGADLFHLGGSGTIVDFDPAEGDRLAVPAGVTFTGTTRVGGDMVVSFTTGAVLLQGVTELDLSQAFA